MNHNPKQGHQPKGNVKPNQQNAGGAKSGHVQQDQGTGQGGSAQMGNDRPGSQKPGHNPQGKQGDAGLDAGRSSQRR